MSFFARSSAKAVETAAQARVDAIVSGARAQAPATAQRPVYREPATFALTPSADPLDQRLAEELAFARRTIEALGDRLCDDPILLGRHHVALQSIDLLAQILGHIGSIVGAADREDAISRVGMIELRNRLNRDRIVDTNVGAGLQRSAVNPFSAH